MKVGTVSPEPCPFDFLVEDDYFPILGFAGSCPNCEDQTGKFPNQFLAVYLRDDGIYHVFKPIEEVRCAGCGSILGQAAVLCGNATIDVTKEFQNVSS
jgi:hypothetical protein